MEEMMKETQIYNLPLDRTLPYFLNHIICGNYLSQMICKEIDFAKGRFFTILPVGVDLKKIFQFEYGGILLASYKNVSNTSLTMDGACSQYIHKYLNENKANVTVVENYILESESAFVHINNVQTTVFDSEVYYLLYGKNSKEEIYKTIRKSSLVWHFLAVMSYMETIIPDRLTKSLMHDICAKAKFVIAGAYDGEGYIFWEKSSD